MLLDKPITVDVLEVIKYLKTSSTLGLKSFSVCYYKKFGLPLSTYLVRFLNFICDGARLDIASTLAFVSVITKLGKV